MNANILLEESQQFIKNHLYDDLTKLIFKGSPIAGVSIQELANQIVAKNKSEKKLPTWFSQEKIYYPEKISIEQTSSEITANYKSKLVSGKKLIDITGGFGVDCYYFSKQISEVFHCEIVPDLSTIVAHNYQQLNAKNITTISGNGIDYLEKTNDFFDWIYIDPSRRNDHKEKVFLLKDCLPDVTKYLDFLFTKTNQILIKVSPILDITNTINELKFVSEIHIIAVQNEVKELLYLINKNSTKEIKILTINILNTENQKFDFFINNQITAKYNLPLSYLYEPNAAILKSGGFDQIGTEFNLFKLHKHSHLYTSNSLIDFPGRRFKIENIFKYDKKIFKKLIPENKANITTRNFPKTVAQIRKETNLKDGGNLYLFFTTDINEKLICLLTKKC
ncbi:THUMP-like domain-containing protein [Polaribacter gangjinensis]|uniref:SAM-dependent methyltransferase n=1 Tax=Polaribacter gangjinensis TaxID=574710 RepID=A0A2S7WBU7_9FLAO|nr:SAM-dependent methyltransferase [Polaribacter gangjinensis]PQJ74731.1 SAM-dependent methyltransferase [Polaribacter gangjinensis]